MSPQKRLEKLPVWYQPEAPLGSAVRYVASLSPKFTWTGIRILKGKKLELGPWIGAMDVPNVHRSKNDLALSKKAPSELVVVVRDGKGRILGRIDVKSHTPNAFGPEEEDAVRKVASELGELWPE